MAEINEVNDTGTSTSSKMSKSMTKTGRIPRRKSHKVLPMDSPAIKKKRLVLPEYPYLSESEPEDGPYPFEPKTPAAQARMDKAILNDTKNPRPSTSGPLVRERIKNGTSTSKAKDKNGGTSKATKDKINGKTNTPKPSSGGSGSGRKRKTSPQPEPEPSPARRKLDDAPTPVRHMTSRQRSAAAAAAAKHS